MPQKPVPVPTVAGSLAGTAETKETSATATSAGPPSHGYAAFNESDPDPTVRMRPQCHDETASVTSAEAGTCTAARSNGRTVSRLLIVGWDRVRSQIMIGLLLLFAVWAAIFFPLIVGKQ